MRKPKIYEMRTFTYLAGPFNVAVTVQVEATIDAGDHDTPGAVDADITAIDDIRLVLPTGHEINLLNHLSRKDIEGILAQLDLSEADPFY